MKSIIRLFYWIFGGFIAMGLLGLAVCAYLFWHFSKDLPDYEQLKNYHPAIATRVYADNGQLIGEFAVQNRLFMPIEKIPDHVVGAFLSAEDKKFFEHAGVDVMGLLRAVAKSIELYRQGQRLEGASTITQQIATYFLLKREQKLAYKIKQILLAFRIERSFTKQEILELYLNEIYLGRGVYGVASAALNYFDKTLPELTISEVAFLAALPKGPSNYEPKRFYDAAIGRRNWVLSRMYKDGKIDKKTYQEAAEQPLKVIDRKITGVMPAQYFIEDVRRELSKRYGYNGLYKGGLSVKSTLDFKLQKLAFKTLRDGLIAYDRRHGWRGAFGQIEDLEKWQDGLKAFEKPKGLDPWLLAVVLDVQQRYATIGLEDGTRGKIEIKDLRWARETRSKQRLGGAVRRVSDVVREKDVIAISLKKKIEPKSAADGASKDAKTTKNSRNGPNDLSIYQLEQIPNVSGALVALDPQTGRILAMSGGFSYEISEYNRATQAYRQPGSSFKPFVYMAALEHGYTPGTTILDAPFVKEQGPGLPLWRPKNYSGKYYGPTRMHKGLAKSRNLMTVRMADKVGMPAVIKIAKDFGVFDDMKPYLPLALGAGETTPLRLTAAYAMIANGGRKISPTLIDRVQDRYGRTIYRHDTRRCDGCDLTHDTGMVNGEGSAQMPMIDARDEYYVADPKHAYQMIAMLRGVVERGTGWRLKSLNRPIAGKTGTTNESRDAWFVGFTPDLAVGVYVGFDQPRTLGRGEAGGNVASPIVKAFFEEAVEGTLPKPFTVPEGIVFSDAGGVMMPFVEGTEKEAKSGAVIGGGIDEYYEDSGGGNLDADLDDDGIY